MGHYRGSRHAVMSLLPALVLGTGAGCIWLVVRRCGRSQVTGEQGGRIPELAELLSDLSRLLDLPDDVIQAILSHLTARDRAVLCLACQKLRVAVQSQRHSIRLPQVSNLSAKHAAELPKRFPLVTLLRLNDVPSGGVLDSVLDVVLPTRRWRAAIPQIALALASAFLAQRVLLQLKQRHGLARVLLVVWLLSPPASLGLALADLIFYCIRNVSSGPAADRARLDMDAGVRPSWLVRWLPGSRLAAPFPVQARLHTFFQALHHLTHLQLGESLVRTSIVRMAAELTQLQSLSLISSPSMCSPSLQPITRLTNLTTFSLVCTSYDNFRMTHYLHHSDDTLRLLSGMSALSSLTMSPCMGVTDAGLRVVAELTGLTRLGLHVCLEVSDEGLLSLSPLTQLRALALTWPLYTTPAGISHLARVLTCVTSLDVSGNQWGVTDESLESVATHMTALQSLNVYMCYGIAGGMALVAPMLSQLHSLTVPWSLGGYVNVWASTDWATQLKSLSCAADSDSCMAHLHRLSGLTSLRLELRSRVSDVASSSLSRLTHLRSLSVDFNQRGSITTPGWYAVLRGLWGILEKLIVQQDSQLDGVSMRSLKILLINLTSIDLEFCEHVPTAGVAEWLAHLPRLQRLGLWQCLSVSRLRLLKLQQQYSYIRLESDLLANVQFVSDGATFPAPNAVNPVA